MARKTYGKTKSGQPITDDLVEKLAAEAEAGYDVDDILRQRGGRPTIGTAAARVESVRLDPELQEALAARAAQDDETTSAVIRKALRSYLYMVPEPDTRRTRVLQTLRDRGPMTAQELAEATGVPPGRLASTLSKLSRGGKLVERDERYALP